MILRRERPFWVLVVVGSAFVSALCTLVAYRVSPGAGVFAPLALAGLALIAWRPIVGVYFAILLVPRDHTQYPVGSLAFTAMEIAVLVTGALALVHLMVARRRPRLHPAHLAFLGVIAVSA